MVTQLILNKIKSKLTPENKKAILHLLSQMIGKYKAGYELERGQDIIGMVVTSGDRIVLQSCIVDFKETGQIKIVQPLHRYEGEELADLLINNIDKVDLSALF